MQSGIGPVPALREHQAGTYQLPSPPLLLRLRHRSGTQETFSPGSWTWVECPRGRNTGNPERKSQPARVQTEESHRGEEKVEKASQKATWDRWTEL